MPLLLLLLQLLILPVHAQTSFQQYIEIHDQYLENKATLSEIEHISLGKQLLISRLNAFSSELVKVLPDVSESPEIDLVVEEFSASVQELATYDELQNYEEALNFTLRDSIALFRVEIGLESLQTSREYLKNLHDIEHSLKEEALLANEKGHDIALAVSRINSAVASLNRAETDFNRVDEVLNAGKANSYRQGEYLKIRDVQRLLIEGNTSLVSAREEFLLAIEALQRLHNLDPWRTDE